MKLKIFSHWSLFPSWSD